MRTETMAKLALTVAAVSLIGNYLQFQQVRARTKDHESRITRLQIEHRARTMQDRAEAFHVLVLGSRMPVPYSERRGMEGDEYEFEYAVRVPEQGEQEFIEWMSAAKEVPMKVMARSYAHESAYRIVTDNGSEIGELYEKFAMTP